MKKMYICENHHHVLLPWAQIRQSHNELNLLTLDHHTDIHDAFLSYLYNHKKETLDALISQIDFRNEATIRCTIEKLKNDEHIQTSIECGIIKKGFVISYDGFYDQPSSNEFTNITQNTDTYIQFLMHSISLPEIQTYPDSNLYVVGTYEYLNDENGVSDDFLAAMLSKIQTMSGIYISRTNFIFDIDLDYFHSYKSLRGSDLMVFRHLLQVAAAITIATEPDFASDGIDPEVILKEIVALARQANGNELDIIDLR